jgi:di/tricarboxylate transporter
LASPTVIIALVGFVTALMEFIIVDNVNQHGFPDSFTKGKIFNMPDKKKLISTASTLAIASVITGFLTSLALKMMPSESKEASYYDKFMG